jgi:23S rRNA pseudouridine1911/1915/1917 synthase
MKPDAVQIRPHTGICHLRAERRQALTEFLARTDLSALEVTPTPELVLHWLQIGAVYVEGRRRVSDITLEPGQLVRLHTRPKRFTAAVRAGGPLRERLALDEDELLVLDKPAGLPTHATLDNRVENAKYLLERELQRPLYPTHRLDIPTAGLLIFAKNSDAQKRLNRQFEKRAVEKIYHALASAPVAPGEYTHYINPDAHVPRPISATPQPGWWTCRLRVRAHGPLVADGTSGFWHEVLLLTGKTHQIRAQFAALQAPLLGDRLYGSTVDFGRRDDELGLECFELAFRDRGRDYRVTRSSRLSFPIRKARAANSSV